MSNAGFGSRTRGFTAGGRKYQSGNTDFNVIQEHEFASTGNFNDFGDLSTTRNEVMSMSNATRGVIAGGNNPSPFNVMEYITMSSSGNAVDFGDQFTTISTAGGNIASPVRGLMCGGENPNDGKVNTIQYITISTLGNSSDFGDMTINRRFPSAGGNAVRGINAQGNNPSVTNIIDFVTIASLGDAQDFGDVSADAGSSGGAASSPTRFVMFEGDGTTAQYVQIMTTGNSIDFGDMSDVKRLHGAVSNDIRAVFGGGMINSSPSYTNSMNFVTIATTGNGIDFGNIPRSDGFAYTAGASDSHGGLSE